MHVFELGRRLEPGTGKRDAIHVAITPCISEENLYPGQRVRVLHLKTGSPDLLLVKADREGLMVVDPFIDGPVWAGVEFYGCLGTSVAGLRHVWHHIEIPDLPAPGTAGQGPVNDTTAASIEWMHKFADMISLTYDEVMETCEHCMANDRRYCFYDVNEPPEVYKYREEMWDHWSRITGQIVPAKVREVAPYTCSCS